MPNNIQEVFDALGIVPNDLAIYDEAFTHSSMNVNRAITYNYERLEFLGDSLIGFVVSFLVYKYRPDMDQGELSVLKSQFIRTESEAGYARKYGLDKCVKVGNSFKSSEKADKLHEDIFESFVGAVLLDQGHDFAYKMLVKMFDEDIKKAKIIKEANPKSALQEAIQADNKETVVYKVVSETGPSHDRHFVMAVLFDGEILGTGEGKSKKEAEMEAASDALSKLAKK